MIKIKSFISIVFTFIVLLNVNAQTVIDKTQTENYSVPKSPEDISPILIGQKIPEIKLPNQFNEIIDLNKLIEKKPTILVFYRGGWCPYCSKQLSGLQEISKDLSDMGYQLLAISTDEPSKLKQSAEKENLEYTLFSDGDVSIAKKLGIAFKAPKNYSDLILKSSGNKNTELLLPVPSVFILDRKQKIRFEYINPNFKERLSPSLLKSVSKSIIDEIH